MKQVRGFVLLALIVLGILVISYSPVVWAAEVSNGAEIFKKNCSSCHRGGANIILAEKNLRQAALKKYGMNSTEAIIKQVTHGKNAMPAFKERLNEQQIKDVATFVLEQSEQGW